MKIQLERRGIEFPTTRPDNSSTSSFDANDEKKRSKLLYTASCSELEESEQLAIVMRESLHEAEHQTSHQTLVSANTNLPFATPSPMAYAPYGNLYTPMHSLPTVYRFAESAYAPMAIPYPPSNTDIVSQVSTSTASISRTPESTKNQVKMTQLLYC